MIKDYYTTKEASELTGASKQIIRTYTERYARFLSTEATPDPGKPRRFTASDLKLMAYVYQQTAAGNMTHDQVLESLNGGSLERFDWELPRPSPKESEETTQSAPNALIPAERLQAAQALLMDAQRREQGAQDALQNAQERIAQLERELGKAQGELSAYKSLKRRPTWLVWLFGGE